MFHDALTNAPHVPRWQALRDSRAMVRNPVAVFERYRTRLGRTFTFHFGGVRPTVVSSDPDFIEHVLRGNRENFPKSDIQVERMVEFQGKGLVNSHGDEWLRQRRLLARGFLPARLAGQLPVQQAVLDELLADFDQEARRGPVDMHEQMVRFTLRLVGKSLFGRSMTDAELEQIADTIAAIQGFIVRQIVQPWMIPWYRLSGVSAKYQRMRVAADQIVLRHIRARRSDDAAADDFLRLMLETPYHDTGRPMPEQQVMIESLQLMVAGNETSSNALSWIFYLLGRHPDYVAQIRSEVWRVIGSGPIDFDALHALTVTRQVVDEALRLYPPFWMIDRIALADDDVCGIRVPAGALVVPYIYGTHHDAAIWPNPESFDPERFAPGRDAERHRFAYLPFGGGPRLCIGNNMALVQILLIIVHLVQRYDFAPVDDRPIGIRPMMLLRPDGPVHLRFAARSASAANVA